MARPSAIRAWDSVADSRPESPNTSISRAFLHYADFGVFSEGFRNYLDGLSFELGAELVPEPALQPDRDLPHRRDRLRVSPRDWNARKRSRSIATRCGSGCGSTSGSGRGSVRSGAATGAAAASESGPVTDPPSTWKARPNGVPGLTLCRNDHPASRRSPHNVIPGSLGERDDGQLSRRRGRPPARHRRGRSPPRQPTRDHADGATLGRWDAKASRRPRRPVTEGSVPGQRQGQRQKSATATATGISDSQQRSATDAPSWTRCSWSPPGRSGRGE